MVVGRQQAEFVKDVWRARTCLFGPGVRFITACQITTLAVGAVQTIVAGLRCDILYLHPTVCLVCRVRIAGHTGTCSINGKVCLSTADE